MVSPYAALIYAMVLTSAADGEMSDAEMRAIGQIVKNLPVFRDYDVNLLVKTSEACAELLDSPDGLERVLQFIVGLVPVKLHDTAYALACDVAVAGGDLSQETLRVLEMLRHRLEVDRLTAAAIERGAVARYRAL